MRCDCGSTEFVTTTGVARATFPSGKRCAHLFAHHGRLAILPGEGQHTHGPLITVRVAGGLVPEGVYDELLVKARRVVDDDEDTRVIRWLAEDVEMVVHLA